MWGLCRGSAEGHVGSGEGQEAGAVVSWGDGASESWAEDTLRVVSRQRDEAERDAGRQRDLATRYAEVIWTMLTPDEVREAGFPDVAEGMERGRRGG